jgi:hypothetical protein
VEPGSRIARRQIGIFRHGATLGSIRQAMLAENPGIVERLHAHGSISAMPALIQD